MLKIKKSDYEIKFYEVDPKKVIEELDIEANAKKEAELNLPLEDANDLDVNEFNIKKYLLDKVKEANEIVINKKAVYNKILFRITEAFNKEKEISYLPEKYKNDFDHYFLEAKEEYENEKKKFQDVEKDYHNFRNENNIDRVEDSKNPLILTAILGFILIIESIFNSYFFAKGNELGIFGGFIQASIVSLINLGVAMLLINLIRNQKSIKISNFAKRFYQFLIVLLSTGIVFFHLLVGHFRTAFTTDPENAYDVSVSNFLNNPFYITGFDSWTIVIIGIILFIIIALDVRFYKDIYPGYTEITKKYNKHKTDLNELKSAISDHLKALEEDQEKDLKKSLDQIKYIFNDVRDIPNYKMNLEAKYKEHLSHLNNSFNLLIKRYRSINQANRKTDKPKYFDRTEKLDGFDIISFELEEDIKNLKKLQKIVENLPDLEASIMKEINNTTNQIRNISEIINEQV